MRWLIAAAALALAGCGGGSSPRVVGVRVATGPLSSERATALPLGAGRALTVAHVLHGADPVFVGGRRARVLGVDRRLDLAWLAVPGLRAAAPARAAAHAGERVTIRALRGTLPATVQRVVTAEIDGFTRPALELRATVLPGDSGAPVVAGDRVLGVVFAGGERGLAYAVSVASTSLSAGIASAHSSRDATSAPAALAKRSTRSSGQPASSPWHSAPPNASPAPSPHTTSTGTGGTSTTSPS
jgi:hypothetical protein